MPQGQSWFDRIFSAPPSTQGLPALSQTPLEQTNPGLAKLRDLIGGFIGTRDALQPTSSGATLTGAAMASLIPLAGVLKMGQGEQAAVKGIKAYHGSPHDFEKFSLDKVGTGQGAQTYGHGLYFAENPTVAQEYKNELGKKVPAFDDVPVKNFAEGMAHEYLKAGKDSALARLDRDIQRGLFTGAKETKKAEDVRAAIMANLDKTPGMKVQGKTYEVAIKADPDEFLHWDKPIADHPVAQKIVAESKRSGLGYTRSPSGYGDDNEFKSLVKWEPDAKSDWNTIQDLRTKWLTLDKTYQTSGYKKEHQAASEAAYEAYSTFLDRQQQTTGKWVLKPDATGADFYKTLVASHGMDPQAATEMLRKAGIKGIKYLDQGSRMTGEGTHNYVVFDDQLIDIMKKYGVALPVAATLKAWRESQQPQAKGS